MNTDLFINSLCQRLFLLWMFVLVFLKLSSQNAVSDNSWLQYATPEEAGFSSSKLNRVIEGFDTSNSAALLVIYKGKVLLSEGDNTRRFMAHSIRKSFLNALYGVYVDRGIIDIDLTLGSLNIYDKEVLTKIELSATIKDLLSARSGIYLPSAYSTKTMEEQLPERGSHTPGSFWYYNNWDFNTLCTIFEQLTGKGIFTAFEEDISGPTGMEDFRQSDGFYRFENDKSIHPAYLFNMSSRDMARLGQLYLNNGEWNEQQLISKEWINYSTSKVTEDLGYYSNRDAYGLLWWISEIQGQKMYYASGSGGHRIMIFPESELVIVHRVNTYEGRNVQETEIEELALSILNAKVQSCKNNPRTVAFQPIKPKLPNYKLEVSILNKYLGDYQHPFLGIFTITSGKNGPELYTNIGRFSLFAKDKNHFYPEDLEIEMEMLPASGDHQKFTVRPVFGLNRVTEKVIFYY